MESTTIIGYAAALIIGIVLGLIGGGGSILTVPVFVYLLSMNPVTATAYSLFVVGVSAFVGAIQNFRKGAVDIKTALLFASPALVGVYTTRRYIVPIIPETVFEINDYVIDKGLFIMLLFALLMMGAAFSMIISKKKKPIATNTAPTKKNYLLIFVEGIIIGVLTGLAGAGGGFLIIPALVLLVKLPMKKAIATSLLIIAIKSGVGFLGDVQNLTIDWPFLLSFTGVSIIGIFIGVRLNSKVDSDKLKKGFGWFVLLIALIIIGREFQ